MELNFCSSYKLIKTFQLLRQGDADVQNEPFVTAPEAPSAEVALMFGRFCDLAKEKRRSVACPTGSEESVDESCSLDSQEELTVAQTRRRRRGLALFTLTDVCLEGGNQQTRALQDANAGGRQSRVAAFGQEDNQSAREPLMGLESRDKHQEEKAARLYLPRFSGTADALCTPANLLI